MDNRPIIFIDSGLGGIPYAEFFHSCNREEKIIYVADRANFPYGSKPKELVIKLLVSLVNELINQYGPKIIVVACNTASVSALSILRENFPALLFVGTVPAIKSAVLASQTRKIGVLGTQRTLDDPYIAELAAKFGPDCLIMGAATAELVDFVEHRWYEAKAEERLDAVKPWVEKFITMGADALVLACTHFLLLLEEFHISAGNDIMIFDSVKGVNGRIESILDEKGIRSGPGCEMEAPIFKITGDDPLEDHWEQLAKHFGFILEAGH
jgi:glutamate racemase